MDEIFLSAIEAAEAIRKGEVTSQELVRACLQRIEEFEPSVGAWAHLDPDHALAQAKRADEYRKRGLAVGPLHGVPVGVKDIIDTGDLPTENGTVLHSGRTPGEDAFLVSRLREAGAVILGKTATTELAVYAPGQTANPHDATRTPGGSSSGSAAAVAAFMTPLAVGSQTNGSIIRPASFCGVFGYKPTHGRISRHRVLAQSRLFDTLGVFARSLGDLALIAEVLMAYDDRDRDMRPIARPALSATLAEAPPMKPRLAFVRAPVWDRPEETTKDAFRELIDHVGEQVDIVNLSPAFDDALEVHRLIHCVDLAKSFAKLYRDGKDKLSAELVGMIEEGQKALAVDYNAAVDRIPAFNDELDGIFEEYDAILTPSALGEAPVGLHSTGDPAFCTIWTMCGVPALNLPLMQGPNGMPLGAQLVSYRGDDARLFRTARWLLESLEE
jgi:Asp-tRNA(Asn)/Glu-tRNA(Gln) amidotransferase A subunit family amidase